MNNHNVRKASFQSVSLFDGLKFFGCELFARSTEHHDARSRESRRGDAFFVGGHFELVLQASLQHFEAVSRGEQLKKKGKDDEGDVDSHGHCGSSGVAVMRWTRCKSARRRCGAER